jgi:two-component system sensor histidine kinase UhpB
LRTLSAQLSHEEELSRRRFARILHEQVGQNLAAIKIVCKDAIDEHAFDKPKMKKVISQILTTLEDTIYSTRELTSELYPVVLDSLGFIPAIGWLVDLVLKPSYIAVFTDIDELVERFPSEDKLSLFRIVQEAFHNIIKHASATEVDIELKKIDSSIQLIIEDNGVGCDLEKIKNDKDKGIGLMLIKERVLSLGGDFKVEHIPENGTKLIIEVPMKH